MQSLLGGADCSTSSNPLKQVAQREGVDNSLFRDRFTSGPSTSSSSTPFRSSLNRPPVGYGPQLHANQTPHPFNLSHLSSALAETPHAQHQQPPLAHFDQSWNTHTPTHSPGPRMTGSPSPSFSQFRPPAVSTPPSDWAVTFDGKGKGRAMSPVPVQLAPQTNTYPPQSGQYAMQNNLYSQQQYPQYRTPYQPTFQPMYSGYQQQQPPPQQSGYTNGGASAPQEPHPAEMEAAFEQALRDAQAAERESHQQPQADNVWSDRTAQPQQQQQKEQEAASEQVEQGIQDDGIEDGGEAKGEFDKVWESLRPEAERLDKLAEWENDFSQFTKDNDDLFDTLNESLNRPDVGQANLDQQMEGVRSDFTNGTDTLATARPLRDGLPQKREYDFAHPNKFDSLDPQQAWAEANHLLASGGSLTDASLLLESYLRRATSEHFSRPGQSEVEAWSLLGQTHAMDEKEEKALSAFEEAREVLRDASQVPVVGEMLTNLAISYVNESYDLAALQVLHQYLLIQHPAHAGSQPTNQRMMDEPNPWAIHREMTEMYLSVAKDQFAQNGQVDPDVQVGLGTLYYMQGDYDEARDCWVAALGERPSDYLLWNRLGATLANSGNPEEAVDAYRRALELKPTFTRAIFNLGVACLNIGVHREAAEHFLAALSLHARSENPDRDMLGMGGEGGDDSNTLWRTLRRALTALDMTDLAERAKPGTDLGMFRQAGFEF